MVRVLRGPRELDRDSGSLGGGEIEALAGVLADQDGEGVQGRAGVQVHLHPEFDRADGIGSTARGTELGGDNLLAPAAPAFNTFNGEGRVEGSGLAWADDGSIGLFDLVRHGVTSALRAQIPLC